MEELVKQIDELFLLKKKSIERKHEYDSYKQALHEFAANRFDEELMNSFLGDIYFSNKESFTDEVYKEIAKLALKHLNSLKRFED